jgi:putative transcriptional regulator
MSPNQVSALRTTLKLSQAEFGQLFGVHPMTVSKWERGVLRPSAYQFALMQQFERTAKAKVSADGDELKSLLIGAGVVAALIWLLGKK